MNLIPFYELPEVSELRKEYAGTPGYFKCNGVALSFRELLKRIVLETGIENVTLPEGVTIDTYNAAVDSIHAIDRTAFKLHYRLGVDHG